MSAFMGLPATPEQVQDETEVVTEFHALSRALDSVAFNQFFATLFNVPRLDREAIPGRDDQGAPVEPWAEPYP